MKYGIIYKITNTVTNKIYIGQTITTLTKRWKMHRTASRHNRSNSALHSSIAKHGPDKFKVEEICSCLDKLELDKQEQYFMELYNSFAPNGYNLKTGGANGKHSQETKNKMSKIRQEKVKDPVFKEKITKNLIDYKESMTDEDLAAHGRKSKEYWSRPGIKEAKSVDIKSQWESLPEKDKQNRTKGFREYWTEDKLKQHSELIKSKELWKTSGCLEKAQEATRKGVKVVEITSGKETLYVSRSKCTKALKMTAQTLIDILDGKRSNEYKGYRFIKL